MIVYVDIEHERVKQFKKEWDSHLKLTLDIKYRLEEVSGDHCLVVRYDKLSLGLLQELGVRAVLVSGNVTEFQHYDEAKLAGLRSVFRKATQPTIGFCGGAQMMAETFGSTTGPIDPNGSGDMLDDNWKERLHESGFTPVRKTADHPLLANLGDEMVLMEAHYWEVKELPSGFKTFAETDITPIQLFAHEKRPLFGTQFHPESWDDEHPDGRTLLENFFKIVDES